MDAWEPAHCIINMANIAPITLSWYVGYITFKDPYDKHDILLCLISLEPFGFAPCPLWETKVFERVSVFRWILIALALTFLRELLPLGISAGAETTCLWQGRQPSRPPSIKISKLWESLKNWWGIVTRSMYTTRSFNDLGRGQFHHRLRQFHH